MEYKIEIKALETTDNTAILELTINGKVQDAQMIRTESPEKVGDIVTIDVSESAFLEPIMEKVRIVKSFYIWSAIWLMMGSTMFILATLRAMGRI